jgi:predicted enzyme related to lactoylglutathione lyase
LIVELRHRPVLAFATGSFARCRGVVTLKSVRAVAILGAFCVGVLRRMSVLINIDVPDLQAAVDFYTAAFGLEVVRRLGTEAAELGGWPVAVFLLRKAAGTVGAGNSIRTYERHWTPVHLDVVVANIESAVLRATAAGAKVERNIKTAVWGKIAELADPFGHGLCLIEFLNRGYDEIAET